MECVNPNKDIKTKLCVSCYKEQPITEFEKVERGRVRICRLCRTCRNRKARETYKKSGRPDRAASNVLQLRDGVVDRDLLNVIIYLKTEYGIETQVKQPLTLSKGFEEYVKAILYKRTTTAHVKLAKIKKDEFVFNLYSSSDKYMRSKKLYIGVIALYVNAEKIAKGKVSFENQSQ